MIGILAIDDGFEVMCGDAAVGHRRHLDMDAVSGLEGFSRRYGELLNGQGLNSSHAAAGFLALGRELYEWLDGNGGQLSTLLQRADLPTSRRSRRSRF